MINRRQLLHAAGAGAIATVAAPVLALVPTPPAPAGLGLRYGDTLLLLWFSGILVDGSPLIRISYRVNDEPFLVADLPIPPDGRVALGADCWINLHPASLASIRNGEPFVSYFGFSPIILDRF